MRIISATCVLLVLSATVQAADAPIDEPAVHQVVERSIAWLESDMQAWSKEQGCAACHHGPMYLWSVGVAKRQGYRVNEPQFIELTRWLLTDDEAHVFPKSMPRALNAASAKSATDRMSAAMMGHRNLSQPTIYLTHALNVLDGQEQLTQIGWYKVIEHLAAGQNEDGSFVGRNAWRPIFNSPQILTLFVVAGIRDATTFTSTSEASEKRGILLKRAEEFLAKQVPDETHQGIILRLLSEPRQDTDRLSENESLVKVVGRLKLLQRPDGGWSQTDDRESDAFATGQSLFALRRAGVSPTDPTIGNGIDFLLQTQHSDGAWPMTSRPNPETGNPADFLNPITYAATAWATLGLTSCVPRN